MSMSSKSKTMTSDTRNAGEATALTDDELNAVSAGSEDLKGASEALTQRTVPVMELPAYTLKLSNK